MTSFKNPPLKFILLAGLFVGTLDILAAFADYALTFKESPLIILKYIASAVFGKEAFLDGTVMDFAGLAFHFMIALLFTAFFFGVYANTNLLSKNRWLTGVLCAIFIWLVMNEIVIPLSNAPYLKLHFIEIDKVIKAVVILIFTMGLPLSFLGYQYFSKQSAIIYSS